MSGNTQAFFYGNAVVVVARGPGKMHLISYASNANLPNHVGAISAPSWTQEGQETRLVISHSYTFTQYAFYWEGAGEAAYFIGDQLARQAVGTSWKGAINIEWGASAGTTKDVSGQVPSAVQRDNQVTCFIVPRLT